MTVNIKKRAMTLIEIMMVVSIIGLLGVFLIPAVKKAVERRKNGLCASKMRIAVNAFELCRSETGSYPEDVNRAVIPAEMTEYFSDLGITWWQSTTEVGGKWDWDKKNNFLYSISIVDPTASQAQLEDLDAMLDDGNLLTGDFRKVSTRYHYILVEE
ncbi:type II secretion system protein [Tichowtungia aerotolerans]|uniref:Prepilin-type N-terminal cleavage/methylation domain-containing protein n=1 Tax=Tichowtungia aerotolerans TaxID=2697043 RepID=A0A6P1MIF8_9BACT|nr:type II secretion system protein [Tichowtungia aerotolerans]QHI70835.1 prepilin-type N-terminal cleavage/methylation domain-containing protein [Tichowtungia aerotolerans]